MWLQVSQILKEFTKGNARKLAFILHVTSQKSEKQAWYHAWAFI